VKAGGYVESIEIHSKTPSERVEAVRWAVITAGFEYSETVEEMVMRELKLW
jgi:hypothetical protein